jgi:hypothetical protein
MQGPVALLSVITVQYETEGRVHILILQMFYLLLYQPILSRCSVIRDVILLP